MKNLISYSIFRKEIPKPQLLWLHTDHKQNILFHLQICAPVGLHACAFSFFSPPFHHYNQDLDLDLDLLDLEDVLELLEDDLLLELLLYEDLEDEDRRLDLRFRTGDRPLGDGLRRAATGGFLLRPRWGDGDLRRLTGDGGALGLVYLLGDLLRAAGGYLLGDILRPGECLLLGLFDLLLKLGERERRRPIGDRYL